MDRAEKKEFVTTLHDVFDKTSVVVVAHYSGLTVAQMQRSAQADERGWGARCRSPRTASPRLLSKARPSLPSAPLMNGPTLIAYSDDPVAAPKVAVAFAKDFDKFVILGGAMGQTALNVEGVRALATLPSLDELRAKLVGLIQAPATKLAQLTTAPAAKLARVFAAYADRDAA